MKRMLIDAAHPEETRVVAINGTRLEELDIETSTKKQLKGNIYLAKVIRIEPSLQAAFVDYGGGRHGFLAFSEIHPDYFQIPDADRLALLAEQKAMSMRESTENDAEDEGAEISESGTRNGEENQEKLIENSALISPDGDAQSTPELDVSSSTYNTPDYSSRLFRQYKIQDVLKRRQIIMVQVVKEERGNKGAALTTYLSLAGRYCVLMPNTARGGGGVSRKITSLTDRRRLKSITSDLEVADGMAVIVRTAGSERTRAEIKRDYEYLLRMWDSIRILTSESVAPTLVYEEANLIKRAIRDLYGKDTDEVLVEGEEGYRLAKDFMRMLSPSHAKKVRPYRDTLVPLFHRYHIESQLDGIFSTIVQLRSGGYIVINPTEALVSIDINSGRSTKERHIEETALKTNLEAADEIARQLRLRDLAGLIVIDFIDMEDPRNNAAVEKRLKEATRTDRARMQIGHISQFGLLELSRQRLRPSLQETSTHICPHCAGTGSIRSIESSAIYILRIIEEEGIRGGLSQIVMTVATQIALYILNQKRQKLAEIEMKYGFTVILSGDDSLIPPQNRIERIKIDPNNPASYARPQAVSQIYTDILEDDAVGSLNNDEEKAEKITASERSEDSRRHGRRENNTRNRDDGRPRLQKNAKPDLALQGEKVDALHENGDGDEPQDIEDAQTDRETGNSEENDARRARRRGKRGGRRRNRRQDEDTQTGNAETYHDAETQYSADHDAVREQDTLEQASFIEGAQKTEHSVEADMTSPSFALEEHVQPPPHIDQGVVSDSSSSPVFSVPEITEAEKKPARKGWWSRG